MCNICRYLSLVQNLLLSQNEHAVGRRTQVKVKGCYINQAVTVRVIGRGSRNVYKKELGYVARLGAEPNGSRPSFELTREN